MQVVVPEHPASLATQQSDKGLIPPAALRAPWGITENGGSPGFSVDPSAERVARAGMDESFVTEWKCAG
ncbi:hypothetical protein PT2222_30404 [Paraburkholderia tropica]